MTLAISVYCRKCGAKILSIVFDKPSVAKASDHGETANTPIPTDSWTYTMIKRTVSRVNTCPNCKRKLPRDPLVRAEVLFGDWGVPSQEDGKYIEYFI